MLRRALLLLGAVGVACAYTCNPSPGINRCDFRRGPPNQTPEAFALWYEELLAWRTQTRAELALEGGDWSAYDRDDLAWARTAFVQPQLMVHDRFLYDRESNRWTPDRLLDDYEQRYGGIDAVLLWQGYPNMGADDRNAFDLIRSLPGGVEGVRDMVAQFHRRGVKVMWPNFPWDLGTRNEGRAQHEALVGLIAETDSDGLNGDTMDGVNVSFYDEGLVYGKGLALQAQAMGRRNIPTGWTNVTHNVASWGENAPYQFSPIVSAYKVLEGRHLVSVCERFATNRTNGLQLAWFNGAGYETWENVWGMFNKLTERDAEGVRRVAFMLRAFADLTTLGAWRPHVPVTLQHGVFGSEFRNESFVLYSLVNRHANDLSGTQLTLPCNALDRFFDAYHGVELVAPCNGGLASLSFRLEGAGFGAVVVGLGGAALDGAYLQRMSEMTSRELRSYSNVFRGLQQQYVSDAYTAAPDLMPEGMVLLPASDYSFSVRGNIQQGDQIPTIVDVQFPWEDHPRRNHAQLLRMPPLYMDAYPATNDDYAQYLAQSGYSPNTTQNYLRHWVDDRPPEGFGRKPVVWVSRADASAYCAHQGKRLPSSWEWQWAAQGAGLRRFPWGAADDSTAHPPASRAREQVPAADVDQYPRGATPEGVHDLMFNVFQWTDEFCDEHTCYAVMRGGSNYGAGLGQRYYFKRPADTREHNTLLMMSESMDRSASFGFRCVVDAVARNDTTCEWQACGATDTLAQDSLIDLSAAGAWTHFGLGDASDVNTKRTADRLQLTLLRENVQPEQYSPAQPAARFSWTDGAPTESAATSNGIRTGADGRGFRLTLPPSTAGQYFVARIYGAVHRGHGKLTATVGTANAHYSTRVPKEGEAEGVESFVSTIRYRSTDNWPTVIDFEIGSDEALVYIYAVTLSSEDGDAYSLTNSTQ